MGRGQRRKQVRRQLKFFEATYGLHSPYKVLVDSQFLHVAMEGKLYLKEELPNILQDKAYLVNELRTLGEEYSGAAVTAKRLAKVECNHENPLSSKECLLQYLKSKERKERYVVGAQDSELRQSLRNVPGIPLLYISFNKVIMEPISEASRNKGNQIVAARSGLTERERKALQKEKEEIKKEEQASAPKPVVITKKKYAKNPNPLSVMKKKRKKPEQSTPKKKTEEKSEQIDNAASANEPSSSTNEPSNEVSSSNDPSTATTATNDESSTPPENSIVEKSNSENTKNSVDISTKKKRKRVRKKRKISTDSKSEEQTETKAMETSENES